MSIYNRWGEKLYETNNLKDSKGWDGTFRGEQVEEGIYFYTISFSYKENGSIFRDYREGVLHLLR